MNRQHYDLIVIGGGSGGLAVAETAARLGRSVAIIEGSKIGGTCVNNGCVPKKVMWYAASLAHAVDDASSFGIPAQRAATDWKQLVAGRENYIDNINRYEHTLTEYAMERLQEVPGIRLIGTAPGKVSVLSFVIEGTRTEDVGRYLDREGIAVRAGHHCAMPTMQRMGVSGTVRPSLAIYNTHDEVDTLVDVLKKYRAG